MAPISLEETHSCKRLCGACCFAMINRFISNEIWKSNETEFQIWRPSIIVYPFIHELVQWFLY